MASAVGAERVEAVRVVVRIRPVSATEAKSLDAHDSRVVVQAWDDGTTVAVHESEGSAKTFKSSAAVSGSCTQAELFVVAGIPGLIESAIAGYSACVFAYGQTGSGKTYTVMGEEDKVARTRGGGVRDTDGLLPRAASFLFSRLQEDRSKEFVVRVTALELYNEQVYDLLNFTQQPLAVRFAPKTGFYAEGQTGVRCHDAAELQRAIAKAVGTRRVAAHNLNARSSRGHCLITIRIDALRKDSADDSHPPSTYGQITFVDLAGSERLMASGSEGDTRIETGQINRSLFALGQVITALSRGATENGTASGRPEARSAGATLKQPKPRASLHNRSKSRLHELPQQLPVLSYRDSKLTMLLRDSLGGRSLTCMIACVTPLKRDEGESWRTLQFAMGVRRVRNRAVVLLDPQEKLIADLRDEIKRLREENAALRGNSAIGGSRGSDGWLDFPAEPAVHAAPFIGKGMFAPGHEPVSPRTMKPRQVASERKAPPPEARDSASRDRENDRSITFGVKQSAPQQSAPLQPKSVLPPVQRGGSFKSGAPQLPPPRASSPLLPVEPVPAASPHMRSPIRRDTSVSDDGHGMYHHVSLASAPVPAVAEVDAKLEASYEILRRRLFPDAGRPAAAAAPVATAPAPQKRTALSSMEPKMRASSPVLFDSPSAPRYKPAPRQSQPGPRHSTAGTSDADRAFREQARVLLRQQSTPVGDFVF